jgi:hypothetical protein
MKLSFASLVFLSSAAAAQSKKRVLKTANDVGIIHNEAIEALAEKYKDNKPSSRLEIVNDVSELSASYCPENDSNCVAKAYEYSLKAALHQLPSGVTFPENFDGDVKSSLESTFSIIQMADALDTEDMVSLLETEQKKIQDMKGVDEGHRFAGLVGSSVAIHSTQLWKKIMNDGDHPLHKMGAHYDSNHHGRYLQGQDDAIAADQEIAIQTVIDLVQTNPLIFLTLPAVIPVLAAAAIPVSLYTFIFGTEDDSTDNSTRF